MGATSSAVVLQVGLPLESSATIVAIKRSFIGMDTDMHLEVERFAEDFVAVGTAEVAWRFFFVVVSFCQEKWKHLLRKLRRKT